MGEVGLGAGINFYNYPYTDNLTSPSVIL